MGVVDRDTARAASSRSIAAGASDDVLRADDQPQALQPSQRLG
ncbi:hypothetical protein [Kibdelosporangium aridum]|nr:hypothetical protein [Kibdelosporangium aridum]